MTVLENIGGICREGVDEITTFTSAAMKKGKKKTQLFILKRKLADAQRELGILVYALHKFDQEDESMVESYIDDIDRIEIMMSMLSKGKKADNENEKAKVCPACGVTVSEEAAFCTACGAQLDSSEE